MVTTCFEIFGYCTSYQNIACFMLYLKIILIMLFFKKVLGNTFLKNNIASYSKLFKGLKNDIEVLVGQTVFKLQIKTVKMLFGSIIQEPIGLP